MSSSSSSSTTKLPQEAVAASIARDANDFIRSLEVERIISAFKLNPYDILDLEVGAPENEVKKQYRKKSLLIHPDKFKHERGVEAFDFLKKAESMLMDQVKRADIDNIMRHTRLMILTEILPTEFKASEVSDEHPLLQSLDPSLDSLIRSRSKEIFVEEELLRRRKQKLSYANEGAEAAKKETEVNDKKRKKEAEEQWEANRDDRVQGWRAFAGNKDSSGTSGLKKKKKKLHVLG